MMKKMSKVISVIMLIMIAITMSTTVLAAGDFDPAGIKPGESNVETGKISSIGNDLVKVLTTIGMVVSVAILVVLGIKYMLGSAEEKAEYKKTLIPYVIGAVLIFAASAVASMVYQFANSIQ